MTLRSCRQLLAIGIAGLTLACGPSAESGSIGSAEQAVSKKPNTLRMFAGRPSPLHGVAGDERLVFAAEPLAQRVVVLDRETGQEIGSVPAPSGGFLLPFGVRVPHTGRLVLLDSGGFPNPSVPSIPRVFDYDYSYDEATGTFSASIARTVSFEGLPVIFAEDVEVTSQGFYVVSEAVIGALWVIDANGAISPGIFPDNPFEPIPQLGPCYFPDTTVDGIPFRIAGNFGPGVNALAELDGDLYFSGVCPGGLQRVPLATLRDTTRSPGQRAADIQMVSPKPAGVEVDAFEGLAVNRFSKQGDRHIYAADSFNLRILKINPDTGEREVLATDSLLLNFPVGAQFLPPVHGHQPNPLLVASDQEHRLAALNAGITEDILMPPFVIAEIYPR